jgi:hypothetical protein
MLCDSGVCFFIIGVDIVTASWINFVVYSIASSSSYLPFSLIFRQIFSLMYVWNWSQLVCLLQCLGGISFQIMVALIVIVITVWSDSRPRLDSMLVYTSDIPFAIAKSSKSGILLASVGQYVGSLVDRIFRLFCCMTCSKFMWLLVNYLSAFLHTYF